MRKGQTSAEYIIVILFFILVTTYLIFSFFRLTSTEIEKVNEQEACAKAELLSNMYLNFKGVDSIWETNYNLTTLGLSTGNSSEINYTKWYEMIQRGEYNVSNSTEQNEPFYISYEAYALPMTNPSSKPPPAALSSTPPDVWITRNNKGSFNISAGSSSIVANAKLTLFIPNQGSAPTTAACSSGALEAGDTNTTTSRDYGYDLEIDWTTIGSDLDCIVVSITSNVDVIYIKEMSLTNGTKEYDDFYFQGTKLKEGFGSSIIDISKNYCELIQPAIVWNASESIPVIFEVISW